MSDSGSTGNPWGSGEPAPEQPPYGGQPQYDAQQYGAQPYGAPQYGAQPYGGYPSYGGYPGYGGYQAPQTDGNAIAALVCAIGSFVVCPLIPAVVALFLARNADASIRASNGAKTGEGLTKAARIVAWINIGLVALGVIALVAVVVIAIVAGTSTDSGNYSLSR